MNVTCVNVHDLLHGEAQVHGTAVLVDRLWPRGVRKADLHHDLWLKEVAPTTELRKWFGHDPEKFDEFTRRYRAELDENQEGWEPILQAAKGGDVTLLYSAHDVEHNNALVLMQYLDGKMS